MFWYISLLYVGERLFEGEGDVGGEVAGEGEVAADEEYLNATPSAFKF